MHVLHVLRMIILYYICLTLMFSIFMILNVLTTPYLAYCCENFPIYLQYVNYF